MYPFEVQVDMILIYGECQRNSVQARILYSERYRILPSRQTFTTVVYYCRCEFRAEKITDFVCQFDYFY